MSEVQATTFTSWGTTHPATVLDGRVAVCTYCKTEQSSSLHLLGRLAFFEYTGAGSRPAGEAGHDQDSCKCGMFRVAHGKELSGGRRIDHDFEPRGPLEKDRYYDGCRGWD